MIVKILLKSLLGKFKTIKLFFILAICSVFSVDSLLLYDGNNPIVYSICFDISISNCKFNEVFSFGLILNV